MNEKARKMQYIIHPVIFKKKKNKLPWVGFVPATPCVLGMSVCNFPITVETIILISCQFPILLSQEAVFQA